MSWNLKGYKHKTVTYQYVVHCGIPLYYHIILVYNIDIDYKLNNSSFSLVLVLLFMNAGSATAGIAIYEVIKILYYI